MLHSTRFLDNPPCESPSLLTYGLSLLLCDGRTRLWGRAGRVWLETATPPSVGKEMSRR